MIVNLLTCKEQFKQYVGQTNDGFRHHQNNYQEKQQEIPIFRDMQQYSFLNVFQAQVMGVCKIIFYSNINGQKQTLNPLKREDDWKQTLKAECVLSWT